MHHSDPLYRLWHVLRDELLNTIPPELRLVMRATAGETATVTIEALRADFLTRDSGKSTHVSAVAGAGVVVALTAAVDAADKEREACARVADFVESEHSYEWGTQERAVAGEIARRIRMREYER